MKALLLKGPGRLDQENFTLPKPGPNEAVIEVEITGLGGSETAALQNPGFRSLPSIMGHGICGVNKEGQRVAIFPLSGCQSCSYCSDSQPQLCNDWKLIGVQRYGGLAEQVIVPEDAVFELPPSLSWEQASFIEPFANAANAWERAQPKPTDSVLIVGAGSVGLGLTAMAWDQGNRTVFVTDLSTSRQAAASELGACRAALSFEGEFDVVFDTVGSEATRSSCINQTRKNGTCVFLGFASQFLDIDVSRIIREQKTLIGSFVFSRDQFKKAMQLARHCRSEWVHNVSWDEVADELVAYARGDFAPVKSAFRPSIANPPSAVRKE